jgi:hypothetical protein
MKYLNTKLLSLALFCIIACSSSIAQDSWTPPAVAQIEPELKLESEPEPVKEIVKPSKPKPRKKTRDSRIERKWLTRICVSEGNFIFSECEKILQTLDNMRGERPLLAIMQRQSARVTRQKPFTTARQIWVSHLPMQGKEPPAKGWVECTGRGVPKGCTGVWEAVLKQWEPFREKVHELYYSGAIPKKVPGVPIQWGGNMDYWRGVGRNFCPLNEPEKKRRNTFWGDPDDPANKDACLPIDQKKIKRSRVLTAAIASGRHIQKRRIDKLLGGESLYPIAP